MTIVTVAEEQQVAEFPGRILHVLATTASHELPNDPAKSSNRESATFKGQDEDSEGLTRSEWRDLADRGESAELVGVEMELGRIPLQQQVRVVEEVGILRDWPLEAFREEAQEPLDGRRGALNEARIHLAQDTSSIHATRTVLGASMGCPSLRRDWIRARAMSFKWVAEAAASGCGTGGVEGSHAISASIARRSSTGSPPTGWSAQRGLPGSIDQWAA